MASSVVTTPNPGFLDPRKSGKCVVQLGKSLTEPAAPGPKLASLRCKLIIPSVLLGMPH